MDNLSASDYAARFAGLTLHQFGHEGAFDVDLAVVSAEPAYVIKAFKRLGCTVQHDGTLIVVQCPPRS